MSVTYTASLPVRDETVDFLSGPLTAERTRCGTRQRTRSLSCHQQAVLVLRWFCNGARMGQLAVDNAIIVSTGSDYLHEGVDVLAARSPGDLGYEGEAGTITVAFKKPKDSGGARRGRPCS